MDPTTTRPVPAPPLCPPPYDRPATRRGFLLAGLAGVALAAVPPLHAAGAIPATVLAPDRGEGGGAGGASGGSPSGGLPPHFPHQDPELVRRVVGASHGDLDTVRELVGRQPELAKAQWDWGFGDWESALGAASHTGHREIADFLLAHGARPTIFSAAMLGQLAVVRAFVEASPGIQATPGPHGIPLLDHARFGGEAAAPVAAYLEEVGGADGGEPPPPLDAARRDRLVGGYRGGGTVFAVEVGRFGLTLGEDNGVARRLVHLGDDTFHPAGAPSVRVRFALGEAGPASAFTLTLGETVLRAERVVAGVVGEG